MKKKVYYKLNRYQVTKVEVETAEQEQAVKMLNREMDRFTKSEDTYYEKCSSLDEMYEESGFEPADDNPNPEEQFIESERQSEIKKQVHKALRQLISFEKGTSGISNGDARNGISPPSREGYSFGGWTTKPEETVAEYTVETLDSAPNGIVLYAIWLPE